MELEQALVKKRLRELVLLSCYGVSGLACFTYEILWNVLFREATGSPELANALTLGVSMAGLAAGNLLGGHLANRTAEPLALYGLAEAFTGTLALGIAAAVFLGLPASTALRPGLVVVSMCPFVLIGLGPPLLTRYFVGSLSEVGARLGLLVFVQTVGALLACFLAGMQLLEHFGTTTILVSAGVVNLANGAVVCTVRKRSAALSSPSGAGIPLQSSVSPRTGYSEFERRVILVLIFFAGGLTMSYELSWAALLGQVSSDHQGVFPAMLFTVIGGMGVGGLAASKLMRSDRHHALRVLGWCQIGLVVAALGGPLAVSILSGVDFAQFGVGQRISGGMTLLAFAGTLSFVPSVLIGLSAPLASRVYTRDREHAGGGVGTILATVTIGNLAGAAVVGLAVLPSLGGLVTLAGTALASAAIGGVAMALSGRSEEAQERALEGTA